MPTTKATKQCRMCFSEIDGRARKCPHCQMLQGVWVVAVPAFVILMMATILASFFWLANNSSHKKQENHSADVTVLDSRLFLGIQGLNQSTDAEGKNLSVVGHLKNVGQLQLNMIELQVQIFNEHNELIDVYSEGISGPFIPDEEYVFKIMGGPIHQPESAYSSHKTIVKNAYNW